MKVTESKTISMRLAQIKTKGGETFYKMQKDLQNVGVELLDSNGNLRSTFNIIKDLSKEWNSGKLNDMTKSSLLDSVAGKHQAKVMSAVLQNSKQLEVAYKTLSNSAGSAAAEQEKYMDSIEGRLNAFKETIKSLWVNSIDTSFVKTLLSGATSVTNVFNNMIQTFGGLPTIIGSVTMALGLFNNKFKESMSYYNPTFVTNWNNKLSQTKARMNELSGTQTKVITDLKRLIIQFQQAGMSTKNLTGNLIKEQLALAGTTVKTVMCTVATTALQAVMSLGLSLAITAATSALVKFGESLFNSKGLMEDCAEQSKELLGSLETKDTSEKLLRQYEELNKKLKDGNLTAEKRAEIQDEIKKVANQLIGLDGDYEKALKGGNTEYDKRLALVRAIQEQKLKEGAKELKDSMPKQGIVKNLYDGNAYKAGEIQNVKQMIASYKQLDQLVSTSNVGDKIKIGNATYSFEEANEKLGNLKDTLTKSYVTIGDWNSNVNALKEVNAQGDLTVIDLDESTQNFMKTLLGINDSSDPVISKMGLINSSVNELTTRGEVSTNTINQLANAFPDLGINISNASEIVRGFRQRLLENSGLISSMKNEISSTGKLSEQSISRLSNIFPELGINASNAGEVLGLVGGELDDLTSASDEAKESLSKLGDEFSQFSSEADMIDKVTEEMKTLGGITDKTYGTLIKSHPEVLAALGSEGDMYANLEALKRKDIALMEDRKNEAIRNALETYNEELNLNGLSGKSFAEACQLKMSSDAKFNNSVRTNNSETTNQNSGNYNNDNKNFNSLANSKVKSDAGFNNNVRTNMADTINNLGTMYTTDTSNFGKNIQAKNNMLKSFINKFNSLSEVVDFDKKTEFDIGLNMNALADPMTRETMNIQAKNKLSSIYDENIKKYNEQVRNIKNSLSKIDNSDIPIINSSSEKVNPSVIRSSDVGGGSGGSKGGSSGSGGKSDAEKQAEEAQKFAEKLSDLNSSLDIDRYFDANNAISSLDNSMSDLKNSQTNLIGSDLINAKSKETEIIKQQVTAYMDLIRVQDIEKNELADSLRQKGFNIDANGKLIKSQDLLAQKQKEINDWNYENSEEGYKKKQDDINALKELQDEVKRYSDLTTSEIPKAIQKWDELSESIRATSLANLQSLREKIVKGLESQYEEEKKKVLDKIDKTYEKRKESLEKEYQSQVDSIKAEKEKTIGFYDEQIKALQKQLDDLEDDTQNKQEKLAKLKEQVNLWKNDDSVFSKKKIEELNKEIADLEKDILKDGLKNQIDDLKDKQKKDEEYQDTKLEDLKNSHDEEMKELEKKYKRDKERKEKHYEEMLKEKNLYAEADKLITKNSVNEILKILENSSESFKEVGSLLGANFAEALKLEVGNALNDFKSMTGQSIANNTPNANNPNPDTSGGKWYDSDGNSGYFDKYGKMQRFDTGGRISSKVGKNGAIAILDRDEKVLNKEDTTMMDRINSYVIMSSNTLNEVSQVLSDFKANSSFMLNGGVSNINKVNRSVSNTDESRKISMENKYNINNYNNTDASFTKRELERIAEKQASKIARKFR